MRSTLIKQNARRSVMRDQRSLDDLAQAVDDLVDGLYDYRVPAAAKEAERLYAFLNRSKPRDVHGKDVADRLHGILNIVRRQVSYRETLAVLTNEIIDIRDMLPRR